MVERREGTIFSVRYSMCASAQNHRPTGMESTALFHCLEMEKKRKGKELLLLLLSGQLQAAAFFLQCDHPRHFSILLTRARLDKISRGEGNVFLGLLRTFDATVDCFKGEK